MEFVANDLLALTSAYTKLLVVLALLGHALVSNHSLGDLAVESNALLSVSDLSVLANLEALSVFELVVLWTGDSNALS